MHCKYLPLSPYKPLEKFSKALYGTKGGTYSARIFRPVMHVTTTEKYMRYHQRLCLEAWHINSAYTPLNRDNGGLLPNAHLHLVKKKCS